MKIGGQLPGVTAQRVLFCELCALKATFRGINYLPEAAAFRVRLTCTFNLRGRRGAARRRVSLTCRGSAASGPRARPTTRRSSASSTATPSALSPSARRTSTATSAREGPASPSTSTASWACWRARSRAPRLNPEHAEPLHIFERRAPQIPEK